MNSSRPYLIRAIYDWVVDSELTPYLLVDAEVEHVTVPVQHIQDGKIILNVSLSAVRDFDVTNEWVMFSARFNGKAMNVSFPPHAVLAVYAKENGRGMVFSEEDELPQPPSGTEPLSTIPPKGKPSLRVVK